MLIHRIFPCGLAVLLSVFHLQAWAAEIALTDPVCMGKLTSEEIRGLRLCMERGAVCAQHWPGQKDDIQTCESATRWIRSAKTWPAAQRHEVFGTQWPLEVVASDVAPEPAWKRLPRTANSSAAPQIQVPSQADTNPYAGTSAAITPEEANRVGWNVGVLTDTIAMAGQVAQGMAALQNPEAAATAKQVLGGLGLGEYGASDQAIANGRRAAMPPDTASATANRAMLPASPAAATGAAPASGKEEIVYFDYKNSTNANCVELRGNTMANKCGHTLLIAFCVTQPQQTKNFFDGSEAMACGTGGGLDNIPAGKAHGLVLYGVIQYFACPYTDYYTPARMKTKLMPQGYFMGTCGNDGNLPAGKVGWTMGGTLVSRGRQ